jgi:hypothetical protein
MPDPARVTLAVLDLVRQAELRRQDRERFRDAVELAAWTLLEHLRVGDQAQVGEALYRVEQITWPETDAAQGGERPHPHGAMALLRQDRVLGTLRYGFTRRKQAEARAALRQIRRFALLPAADNKVAYNLIPATDDDRMDFAQELPEVIQALAVDVAAHAAEFTDRAEEVVRVLLARQSGDE